MVRKLCRSLLFAAAVTGGCGVFGLILFAAFNLNPLLAIALLVFIVAASGHYISNLLCDL